MTEFNDENWSQRKAKKHLIDRIKKTFVHDFSIQNLHWRGNKDRKSMLTISYRVNVYI